MPHTRNLPVVIVDAQPLPANMRQFPRCCTTALGEIPGYPKDSAPVQAPLLGSFRAGSVASALTKAPVLN
jgi:hypothetical protein